jgi:predicted dehydrogenase
MITTGGENITRQLRVVLVGCGDISRAWLDGAEVLPALDVVGLVDLREEVARQRANEYGLDDVLVSTDLTAMLDTVRPDVVFDCTVPEAHADVTLEALHHGCHVLGEKPMADSLDSARRVVAAAHKAGRTYAVMQNYRYNAGLRRLQRFLVSGAIGPITTVHSDFYIGAHFGGFRDHMAHVLLLDMAIHTFDAARAITGADPVSVYCKEWNPSGSWFERDASAVAIFEMTEGIVYAYRGSWCAEGLNTPWNSAWRVIGEKGSVVWDGRDGFRAQVVAETGGFHSKWRDVEVPTPGDVKVGGHAGLIADFVHCLETGATPETACADNLKSLAMVFGAVESAERGEHVKVRV